jgi:hypothetical protein
MLLLDGVYTGNAAPYHIKVTCITFYLSQPNNKNLIADNYLDYTR